MKFKDKVAIVTGASVGIGRAAALKLAAEGAKLCLVDIDFEKLKDVESEILKYTKEVEILRRDVSDEKQVNEAVESFIRRFGKIDILVNNAALWKSFKPFLDTPVSLWKQYIDINIMGVVYFTRAVLDCMIKNGYGKIINVASVAGIYGNVNMVHYSATKGAVIAFTKALAKEVADKGVNVNCVSPGTVSPSDNPDVNYHQPNDMSYMGRTGTDMENAELICFLASDEAGYISGQNIQIDGCRKKI